MMPTYNTMHHAAGSHAEKKAAVDPIIQQLLKNARSEAVRQEFLSMPQGEYTSKHSIEVLVSVQDHCNTISVACCCTLDHAVRISAFLTSLAYEDLEFPDTLLHSKYKACICIAKLLYLTCTLHAVLQTSSPKNPVLCIVFCPSGLKSCLQRAAHNSCT